MGCAFCARLPSELLRWPSACWGQRLSQVSRVSCTSQVLTTQVPGCSTRAWSQFPGCALSPLGSWSQAVTLLEDVNCPGCQEDVVSSWQPQFGGRYDLWGRDCSSPLPSSSGCCPPASLPLGREAMKGSWVALLWYSLNPLFCEHAGDLHVALQSLVGTFLPFCFCLTDDPTVWIVTLAPSDCPQGFTVQFLPKDGQSSPCLCPAPSRWWWRQASQPHLHC